MAIQDHVLNLNKIHSKMKNKPVRYRLYNFFQGVPNMLEVKQLAEIKKIAIEENDKLIKGLDKKIAELSKPKKKQTV
jgi:hypothetical protein